MILEPEFINHGATACTLSEFRGRQRLVNDPRLTAHLVCGRAEYVIPRGGFPYVMPHDSCAWRGSLPELRDCPPVRPQHPETPHHEATGHESYIRPQIPHWRELGCELGWIDMTPIATGTYAPVASNFPSGLDACREEMRANGLGASFILNPDYLDSTHHAEWTDELERRFGDCRHSVGGKTLCLASRWGEHAAAEFARVVREYDLCLVQVAFNHNQPVTSRECCTQAGHNHAPAGADAADYVRGYLAAHNRIYAAIRTARPGTLVLENLPTVYDLGNPCPDAMWTADTMHQPQLVTLLLDYIAAQRRLWPMAMRFVHVHSMNLEPEGESTFLVANIALGNLIVLGDDFRHTPPGLRAFCKKWIAFYREHRQWLCADLHLLASGVIGHRLPGEFMVFAFNGDEREQQVDIRFTANTAGLPATALRVTAEHADRQQPVGETRPTDGGFTWSTSIPAFGFAVLRFRPASEAPAAPGN